MIQYFKELLATLKRIEEHLAQLRSCIAKNRYDQECLSVREDGGY